jgi:hypothetical protein
MLLQQACSIFKFSNFQKMQYKEIKEIAAKIEPLLQKVKIAKTVNANGTIQKIYNDETASNGIVIDGERISLLDISRGVGVFKILVASTRRYKIGETTATGGLVPALNDGSKEGFHTSFASRFDGLTDELLEICSRPNVRNAKTLIYNELSLIFAKNQLKPNVQPAAPSADKPK